MQYLKIGSRGSDVAEVQYFLQQWGYDPGPTDGIFGPRTDQAVRQFQSAHGLVVDGIVGPVTYQALRSDLPGTMTYTVKPGDTLYSISVSYGISIDALIAANPGVDSRNLQVGRRLRIPVSR
ncbi:peptidoglycan-binding protein [Desulfosporosinus sp. PR]|uniref:peptidoglycan-binding protein n=1 Tax=Candidatus Desulfosporosinus nitrosoreducens TaxID=3401928 RepID=UPI0027EFAC30|nr:peptidoglycan-binding protein [Desulfosporosinus sp. PR]MDQ7094329.1 peptidoglycan-binding protein [Desulfosporosinus sp. PR]